MRIKFWDKSEVIISKEQWEKIKALRDQGAEWIVLKNPSIEFNPKSIVQVTPSAPAIGSSDIKRLPSKTEMSEEQRLKNLKHIAKLRRDFAKKAKTG